MSRMPQVTARELVRFLKSQGSVEDRQSGAHLTLWLEARKVSVTVPIHTGSDEDMVQWVGRHFDRDAFDLAAVNRKLRLLK